MHFVSRNRENSEFPLSTVDSFRIPLRRNKIIIPPPTIVTTTTNQLTTNDTTSLQQTPTMYEQTLDFDTFNSYLSQNGTDPNESRFYDDFFTMTQQSHEWKSKQKLPGLPTPPSTPDKFKLAQQQQQQRQQQQQQQHDRFQFDHLASQFQQYDNKNHIQQHSPAAGKYNNMRLWRPETFDVKLQVHSVPEV